MSEMSYMAPERLEDALAAKAEHGAHARVVAGATDLILRMRDGVLRPDLLIDLRRLALDAIELDGDALRLGAYATHGQLLADPLVAAHLPALRQACSEFAGPPIRNRGTLGGNLVNASPAADLVPPLLAYDACVILDSADGRRELPLAAFFTGPGQTVLRPDEILTEVRLPLPPAGTGAEFIKLGQRRSMAISVVSVAARLSLGAAGEVQVARIALGAVAPTVVRAAAAEEALQGHAPDADRLRAAAGLAGGAATPISDPRASREYRARMVPVLVRRALEAAWSASREAAAHG